jgi:hypothetical protein
MKKNQTFVIIVLLIIGIILFAGCTYPASSGNQTNNVSVNVTTPISAITPAQTQCPVPVKTNCSVWLTMNLIADHHPGDIFEVNGTIQQKNWTVENAAKIHVEMECYSNGHLSSYRTIWPKGIAFQHPSDCEVKTWSYQVNLTSYNPPECDFYIYTLEECGGRSAHFNVTSLNSDISVDGERV